MLDNKRYKLYKVWFHVYKKTMSTCFSSLMGVDSAFTSGSSVLLSITFTGDTSCTAMRFLCGLGFTLGLAPPTGMEFGLELLEIDELRSRESKP